MDIRFYYTLDGYKMQDKDGFYNEIEKAMFFSPEDEDGPKFKMGHTLDSFADILRGGFGKHEYGEPIEILWCNFTDARKNLGDDFILKVITLICNDENDWNVTLKIEK